MKNVICKQLENTTFKLFEHNNVLNKVRCVTLDESYFSLLIC